MAEQLRILFVEDEPDIAKTVETALGRDPNILLTSYRSGLDVLNAVIKRGQLFDFAIINLRSPFTEGVNLHEKLRQLPGLQDLRTAIMTAAIRQQEVEDYRRPGIVGLIPKPIASEELAMRVRVLIMGR